jgi:hypothetical protein
MFYALLLVLTVSLMACRYSGYGAAVEAADGARDVAVAAEEALTVYCKAHVEEPETLERCRAAWDAYDALGAEIVSLRDALRMAQAAEEMGASPNLRQILDLMVRVEKAQRVFVAACQKASEPNVGPSP